MQKGMERFVMFFLHIFFLYLSDSLQLSCLFGCVCLCRKVNASIRRIKQNDPSNVLPNIKCLFWVVIFFSCYFAWDHDDLLYCSNNRNNNPIKTMWNYGQMKSQKKKTHTHICIHRRSNILAERRNKIHKFNRNYLSDWILFKNRQQAVNRQRIGM